MAEYYGTKELAEITGYKQATMQKWCREQIFPTAEHDAVGSPWRVSKNDPKLKQLLHKTTKDSKRSFLYDVSDR